MGRWKARNRVQRIDGQRSEGEKEDPLVVVEDEGKGWRVWGQGNGKSMWYDVEDIVEGKGTGGEKDQLGVVEEDENGGGG